VWGIERLSKTDYNSSRRGAREGLVQTYTETMTLEDQLCSVQLAKRLKTLGVKQESYFDWLVNESKLEVPEYYCNSAVIIHKEDERLFEDDVRIIYRLSAFTIAELGEMLPTSIEYQFSATGRRDVYLETGRVHGNTTGWYLQYTNRPHNYVHCSAHADAEADARAKMLIYLIEQKLITLP
jgi:hypothetical protein